MSSLAWSEALVLHLPAMDATHEEFVALLGEVQAAGDADLLARWRELVDHTQAHFDLEDRWMQDTGFHSANCHSTQHAVVLNVLREGTAKAEQGQLHVLRQMAGELAVWFPHHAQTMDFGLALHLKNVGFDTETATVSAPQHLPATPLTHCGGQCADRTEIRDGTRDEKTSTGQAA